VEYHQALAIKEKSTDYSVVNHYAHLLGNLGGVEKKVNNKVVEARSFASVARTTVRSVYGSKNTAYAPTEAFKKVIDWGKSEGKNNLYVIANKDTVNGAGGALADQIRRLKVDDTLRYCSTQWCKSKAATASMHAKFALFSRTTDSSGNNQNYVVWISTSNLDLGSGHGIGNSSITIYGDKALYDNLKSQYWDPMFDPSRDYQTAARDGIRGSLGGFAFYPSPAPSDSIAQYLDAQYNSIKTRKKGEAKIGYCEVVVVQSHFTKARTSVLAALTKLKDKCNIKLSLLERDFTNAQYTAASDAFDWRSTHDKIVAIKYLNTSGKPVTTTFFGSANLNAGGLNHNEMTLKTTSPEVFHAVKAHSQKLLPKP
jgi:hypothetical protein